MALKPVKFKVDKSKGFFSLTLGASLSNQSQENGKLGKNRNRMWKRDDNEDVKKITQRLIIIIIIMMMEKKGKKKNKTTEKGQAKQKRTLEN